MIIYTIFGFLLQEIEWIPYMIGVYMKWNPKQHPSMYYDANTQNRRRNSKMIILDRNVTSERHCSIWWKQNVDQILSTNKIFKLSKEFTLFYIWRWCQQLRKYGNSKIWPWKFMANVTGKVSGQGHTWNKSTYVFILLLFLANRTMHSKDIDNLSFDLEISRSRSVPNSRNMY